MTKKRKNLILLFVDVAVFLSISYIFCFPYKVDGGSMEPNYYTGDKVFISHISAWSGNIERGDTVVCQLDDIQVIKRVIALPGDKLEVRDGLVYVNYSLLNEPYLDKDIYTGGAICLTLNNDEYFVMGDNRGVSYDSRKVGAINGDDIKGKVVYKF